MRSVQCGALQMVKIMREVSHQELDGRTVFNYSGSNSNNRFCRNLDKQEEKQKE